MGTSTTSIDSLIGDLRRLQILEEDQLDSLEQLPEGPPSPEALAKELRERGWVTSFQAEQLAHGRVERLSLGQYILLEHLGSGGMGEVFKARHRLMHRVVALKIIRREHVASPASLQRFHREIRAAAQLAHPNVVLAFDADHVGETHFMVMEYVEGIDLSHLVKKHGPLPVGWACDFIRQAAIGLHHAHEQQLVHRDVKPSNLLLTWTQGFSHPGMLGATSSPSMAALAPQAIIKVLDLGLARLLEVDGHRTALTHEGQFMGTPDFIAPEQALAAHEADARADLYSLGCSLYYLLSGRVPFPGMTVTEKLLKHQLNEPEPLRSYRPDLAQPVIDVVQRLMAKQPADRYPNCGELVLALLPYCQTMTKADFEQLPPPLVTRPGDNETSEAAVPSLPNIGSPDASNDPWIDLCAPTGTVGSVLWPSLDDVATTPPAVQASPLRRRVALLALIAVIGVSLGALVVTLLLLIIPPPPAGQTFASRSTTNASPGERLPDHLEPEQIPHFPREIVPRRDAPGKLAYLLGISPPDGEWKKMPCAEKDMGLLADRLGRAGFRTLRHADQSLQPLQPLSQARGQEIRTVLEQLKDHLPGDHVIMALACHVIQFAGEDECYLCPADARVGAKTTLIPLTYLYEKLGECPAEFKLLLLDVCRRDACTAPPNGVQLKPVSEPQRLAPPKRTAVFFSCSLGSEGHEARNLEQGVFFLTVADALDRARELASRDADLDIIEEFIKKRVFAFRPPEGQPRQLPVRLGFTGGKAPAAPSAFNANAYATIVLQLQPLAAAACSSYYLTSPPLGWRSLLAPVPDRGELAVYDQPTVANAVLFTPSGDRIISGGSGKACVYSWSPDTRQPEKPRDLEVPCVVRGLASSPDGTFLLVGTGETSRPPAPANEDYRNGVYVIDWKSDIIPMRTVFDRKPNGDVDKTSVRCVAFAPDGKTVFAGCTNGGIRVWAWDGKDLRPRPRSEPRRVSEAILSIVVPDGKQAIATTGHGTIFRWDVETGQRIDSVTVPGKPNERAVHCSALLPDGRLLTGGDDRCLTLWEIKEGIKKLATFEAKHAGAVRCLAVSPDGSRALTGGGDRKVLLWDLTSGTFAAEVGTHADTVNSVAFSPDGRHALSGGEDRKVRLWALPAAAK